MRKSERNIINIMIVKIEPRQVGICCGTGVEVGTGGVSVDGTTGVSEGEVTVTSGVGVIGEELGPSNVNATSPGAKRYRTSPPAPLVFM